MCRKYAPLTRCLARWIYPFVDRYEWGLKRTDDDRPRFVHGLDHLNAARATRCYRQLRKLTMTTLEQHLHRDFTAYFTSRAASTRHLVMVDIDAHGGEPDAWDAAQWIVERFFRGAYWEPSTNGCGAHLYLPVHVGYQGREAFNQFASGASNSMACCLAAIVADAGFEAPVCGVYGLCGVSDDGQIRSRGHLAKVPRPRTLEDASRLEEMPTFNLTDFKAVADEADLREVLTKRPPSSPSTCRPVARPHIPVNRLSTRSLAADLMASPNAWERSKGTVMMLAQQLGRMPQLQEVATQYEISGLGTSDAEPDRERRHQRALRGLQRSFDPAKAIGYGFHVGQYLDALRPLADEATLAAAARDARYPRRLTIEDLDVALGFHAKHALRLTECRRQAFTAPVDGMIAWFRALKRDGLIQRSCNYGKVVALRVALLRTGMITVIDEAYRPSRFTVDGIGIAKRWGLGENCPQYADHATLRAILAVGTENTQRSSYTKIEAAPG